MLGLKHFHNLVLRAFSSTIFKMVARHFEKWRLAFLVFSCDGLKTKDPLFVYISFRRGGGTRARKSGGQRGGYSCIFSLLKEKKLNPEHASKIIYPCLVFNFFLPIDEITHKALIK